MLEGIPSSPLKIIGNALNSIYRKYFPKKYGYRVAPRNILEIITPGAYIGKIKELLGEPHLNSRVNNETLLAYRFTNALLQINITNDHVDTATLVSLNLNWPNRFDIFPLPITIGSDSFCSLNSHQNPMIFTKEYSTKFFIISTKEYFGFPGRYMNYLFSSIEAATYPTTTPSNANYEFEEIETDEDFLIYGTIKTKEKIKFNAVTISREEIKSSPFIWSIFS